jgi:hypothetical protein
LIIRAGDNPRKFMMEKDGANVVQMSSERKQTALLIVVPDLDPIVVTAGDKHGLSLVEIDSSDWTVMFLETVYQSSHSVVPQLDRRGVQGD